MAPVTTGFGGFDGIAGRVIQAPKPERRIMRYELNDEERSLGGGFYVWPSRAEAERWHGDAYKEKVLAIYGSPPRIRILGDAVIHVAPRQGLLIEV